MKGREEGESEVAMVLYFSPSFSEGSRFPTLPSFQDPVDEGQKYWNV
jgi:hypothetical protein